MRIDRFFDEAARARIVEAVRAAERGTAGEIVTSVASASDAYEEAYWRASAFFALMVVLGGFLRYQLTPSWAPIGTDVALTAIASAGLFGALLVAVLPSAKRAFAGAGLLDRRVRQAADAAFRTERVGGTRDGTGILIFVSLAERRVVVLPDRGIAGRAPEGSWDGAVAQIVEGMKKGRPADGLIAAVELCGQVLHEAGIEARADDANELPDAPNVGITL